MAISGVDPKCYILALFVRDDGTRFLLGDDPYEFKDKQLHFQPNTMANDVVEVQGNDGYLLAGQVRRPGTQSFDGYVGNGTNSKAEVEAKRRDFLQFFRRSHFYKVIYVFPNGTAIQRKQGFLVDDPTVQELYQQYPEYHVALNFEDVNYYTYEEDDQGHEIYAEEAIIRLVGGGATGGLIWDENGVVWESPWGESTTVSGTDFQIDNLLPTRVRISDVELQGDTYQQTYSGKNKVNLIGETTTQGLTSVNNGDGTVTISGTANTSGGFEVMDTDQSLPAGTYTLTISRALPFLINLSIASGVTFRIPVGSTSVTTTLSQNYNSGILFMAMTSGTTYNETFGIQLTSGSTPDTDFEPYVGGIPSPNPDYPQDVQTVTGEQTVTISNGTESQEYEINLGKNLWGGDAIRQGTWNSSTSTSRVTVFIQCSIGDIFSFTNPDTTNYQVDLGIVDSTNQGSNTRFTETGWTHDSTYTYISQYNGYLFAQVGTINGGAITVEQAKQIEFQLEKGSATSYAPYFTPIELCKIGTYQDYIYKGNDGWYLYKRFNKFQVSPLAGTSASWTVQTATNSSGYYYIYSNAYDALPIGVTNSRNYSLCNVATLHNTYITRTTVTDKDIVDYNNTGSNKLRFMIRQSYLSSGDSAGFDAFLSATPTFLYYPVATPTDTKITNADLVAQLDALGAMRLFIGENNILVTSAGSNLPAMLQFDYYTQYIPLGAEWEEGGTKGPTIVDVNAIDNTYPVWELTGPAINPTLSVLTTNTTLTYNGTITASQTLVIDMFNKTATLNGTSVIGNVSGDWVYMAPGTNRVAYTAGNTDAPDSKISWQEVVG